MRGLRALVRICEAATHAKDARKGAAQRGEHVVGRRVVQLNTIRIEHLSVGSRAASVRWNGARAAGGGVKGAGGPNLKVSW